MIWKWYNRRWEELEKFGWNVVKQKQNYLQTCGILLWIPLTLPDARLCREEWWWTWVSHFRQFTELNVCASWIQLTYGTEWPGWQVGGCLGCAVCPGWGEALCQSVCTAGIPGLPGSTAPSCRALSECLAGFSPAPHGTTPASSCCQPYEWLLSVCSNTDSLNSTYAQRLIDKHVTIVSKRTCGK